MKQYLAILTPASSYLPVGLDECAVVFSKVGTGLFDFVSDAFTQGQTFAFVSQASQSYKASIAFTEEGAVHLSVVDANGLPADPDVNYAIHILVTV